MKKKTLTLLAIALILILISSTVIAYYILNKEKNSIRIACVGDSLTQLSEYPYKLWLLLGNETYSLRNFGMGSTTVSLSSETPYMNTIVFQDALEFQPNIVIVMLGTNDAQPSLHQYNASFVEDYSQLIHAFANLESNPEIWILLPPPIFSSEISKIDPQYFNQIIIPSIQETAKQNNLQTIDVFSILDSPDYFSDGVHINSEGAKLIANNIYKTIFT